MKQEMTGFWDTVASAGRYADSLHLLQTDNRTNTPITYQIKNEIKRHRVFLLFAFL